MNSQKEINNSDVKDNELSTLEQREIDVLNKRLVNQEVSISKLQKKNMQYFRELNRAKISLDEQEEVLNKQELEKKRFESSLTYEFLVHAKSARSSFSGFIRFPVAVFRLYRRWFKIKKSNVNLNNTPDVVDAITPANVFAERSIDNYVFNLPNRHKIRSLLYADIDLNIIDGSSVWLTSMANLLADQGGVILVVKKSISSNNLIAGVQKNNVHYFYPEDLKLDLLPCEVAIETLQKLDRLLPSIQKVVVRGLNATALLHETRQFKSRSAVYLTDFYQYGSSGRGSTAEQMRKVNKLSRHVETFLVQTDQIGSEISNISNIEINKYNLPPLMPIVKLPSNPNPNSTGRLKMVYAGKITPDWGVCELLDWHRTNSEIHLTIISNKISSNHEKIGFKKEILDQIARQNVSFIEGLPRSEVMRYIAEADFVWCWRPKELETSTIELSTKLIEAAAMGKPAIAYPSTINKELLGEDYPYFAFEPRHFPDVIKVKKQFDLSLLANRVSAVHSFENNSERFASLFEENRGSKCKLLFSGHDFKFIDAYVSQLKADQVSVDCDNWEWGAPQNIERSLKCLDSADVIFCEWGLANAVWYSKNVKDKPLFIRVHLQEIHARAKKFGYQIDANNVTKFIFVSARVRDEAIDMFGWPKNQTIVIPNFVLDDEYSLESKSKDKIVLGMVGIVPERKRLDRAVELLNALLDKGFDAILRVKGHRPENLDFMHAPGRKKELDYYQEIYTQISSNSLLNERVKFDPWGNDVAEWYTDVDYVLSCSDFESFHYSLADGVLSGCIPLIWPWQEARELYKEGWIVEDTQQALNRIVETQAFSEEELNTMLSTNRKYICNTYGTKKIFSQLDSLLGI